jgi:rare lipoprotein A
MQWRCTIWQPASDSAWLPQADRALSACIRHTALIALALLAAGCSTLQPAPSPDNLPGDAVPRVEPRSRYGNPVSYEVFGRRYFVTPQARGFREQGTASWYGPGFHRQRTSSGEPYDMYLMTAAHKTLPIPVYVRVDNLQNGRSIVVRVNDRGPFVGDRVIDLSYAAAARLDMLRAGTAPVALTVIEPPSPTSEADVIAAATTPAVAAPTAATPASDGFVQAGAFSAQANADALRLRLSAAGFSRLEVQSIAAASGQPLFRLRIGPVSSAAEADDLIERLALAGIPDARLVSP